MPERSLPPEKRLEDLRHIYGTDDAVEEIGSVIERQQLERLLKNPGQFTREEFLKLVAANYSGYVYGEYQWQTVTGGWTTPEELSVYGQFRQNYPDLVQLSLDPGVMTHLLELVHMLEKGEADPHDHKLAREALKQKLGYQTMWRGISLTESEARLVAATGMLTPLAQYIETSAEAALDEFAAKGISVQLSNALEKHYHRENPLTSFLSVTAYPDLAIALGKFFSKRDEDRIFYLFELKLPVLDIVFYRDHALSKPRHFQKAVRTGLTVKIEIDGEVNNYPYDANLESYVYWKLNSQEIVNVSIPAVTTSAWNGLRTQWR